MFPHGFLSCASSSSYSSSPSPIKSLADMILQSLFPFLLLSLEFHSIVIIEIMSFVILFKFLRHSFISACLLLLQDFSTIQKFSFKPVEILLLLRSLSCASASVNDIVPSRIPSHCFIFFFYPRNTDDTLSSKFGLLSSSLNPRIILSPKLVYFFIIGFLYDTQIFLQIHRNVVSSQIPIYCICLYK